MKKLLLSIVFICILFISYSQGIKFEQGNWKEVIALAKKENKLIYLDVYTTWCGPCKMMAKKYFPDEEIGNSYNKSLLTILMMPKNAKV